MSSPVRSVTSHPDDISVHEGRRASVPAGVAGRVQHATTFKLRFEASREPGRSYVSVVRPLNLPLMVTDKFYSGTRVSAGEEEGSGRALHLVTDKFVRGPRDRYPAPVTSAQEYGWWVRCVARDPRLDHRIRDSPWLKERLRVLAADDKLKLK